MAKEDFKPRFKGYLKLYLHDDSYEQATKRMEIRGEWRTKRYRIIKKPRRFQVSFTSLIKMVINVAISPFAYLVKGMMKH